MLIDDQKTVFVDLQGEFGIDLVGLMDVFQFVHDKSGTVLRVNEYFADLPRNIVVVNRVIHISIYGTLYLFSECRYSEISPYKEQDDHKAYDTWQCENKA